MNTIKNFLVGVGLDTKDFDKGSEKVDKGLDSFRTKAGFAGAAMVSAMVGAGLAAVNAGSRIDKLNLSTSGMDASTKFVHDYGGALTMLGGEASEAEQALKRVETALTNFRVKGDFGDFQNIALAGIDTTALTQAKDSEEFIKILAELTPELNKDQQRILQESFGFSDAVMQSLRGGRQALDQNIARVAELTGDFTKATESAREYNKQIAELQLRIEGIGNSLATSMLPGINGILDAFGNFIDDNKSFIESAIENPSNAAKSAIMSGYSMHPGVMLYESYKNGSLGNAWDDTKSSVGGWLGVDDMRQGAVDSNDVKTITPDFTFRDTSTGEVTKYTPPEIKNNLDITLELDGRAIESKVTNVIERREQATIDDMQSTTVR
ncbi:MULTISPECIES: hypothetical protein [unclassified Methylophaga]|uniref:hypothetical protein n=1 Tax=unclassified Methylophaga TaxID=2629249 RepID=UPI00259C8294|nr:MULTISPECIES: hypothetical protein [unclassified Methylophaga]